MWDRLKRVLGIGSGTRDSDEIIDSLYGSVVNRNLYFHLFIIIYELIMLFSISLRPGGPFVKPRRTAYFLLYLALILATACVAAGQAWIGRKKGSHRCYFRIEHGYMVFFSFWGLAITLNDQLGGNGLTVYNYVMLIMAIMSMMKPWKTALLFLGDFLLLNLLLPYFPDPVGLDHAYNNLMNSLFLSLAAIVINASLYNSRIQAKRDEMTINRQYRQIEAANQILSKEALLDALTGLQNRNSYKKAVQAFDNTEAASLACVYVDANGLHELNNRQGHEAGDVMLKTVAHILLGHFNQEEVFRIGGDEFVVLCKNMTYHELVQGTKDVCREAGEAGYSLSIGLDWRESNLDINEIIQAADAEMQKNKEEYYSAIGGERRQRTLDRKAERVIADKRDMERLMEVLAPVLKGVYFVNLETDRLRQVIIPAYFTEMLEETDGRFSKALMLYGDRMVKNGYIPDFKRFCDYTHLKGVLDGEDTPEFTYETKDGCRFRLRVFRCSTYSGSPKETLWIFSDLEKVI